jgi:hypothetical protein
MDSAVLVDAIDSVLTIRGYSALTSYSKAMKAKEAPSIEQVEDKHGCIVLSLKARGHDGPSHVPLQFTHNEKPPVGQLKVDQLLPLQLTLPTVSDINKPAIF